MAPTNFTRNKAIDITHLRNIKCEDKDPYEFTFFYECQVILIKNYLSKSFCTFLSIWSPSAVAPAAPYLAQITPTVVLPCRKNWLQITLIWYEIPAKSIAQRIPNDLPVLWALKFPNCFEYHNVFYVHKEGILPP